jgi:hypothetical protein
MVLNKWKIRLIITFNKMKGGMLFDTTINPFLHQSRLALLYRTANLVV